MNDEREEGFADAAHVAIRMAPVGPWRRALAVELAAVAMAMFDDVETLAGCDELLGAAYDVGPADEPTLQTA